MKVQHNNVLADLDFLILAGGLGTRLGLEIPKALVPIGPNGQPLLSVQLYRLKKFGVKRVILALSHKADEIDDALDCEQFVPDGLEVVCSIEPKPSGTAGALRYADHLIRSSVFVMNADTLVDIDPTEFVNIHNVAAVVAAAIASVLYTQRDIISTGMCIFSRAMLDKICMIGGSSLENDILPNTVWNKVVRDCEFLDIGTPERLALAPTFLKEMKT